MKRREEILFPDSWSRTRRLTSRLLSSTLIVCVIGPFIPAHAKTIEGEEEPRGKRPLQSDASTEDIFEAIFGRKPGPSPRLKYPVILLGANRGDIEVLPSQAPGQTEIDSQALAAMLSSILIEERFAELESATNGQKTITAAELEALGYIAEFDASNLTLQIDVPLEFRSIVPIPLQQRRQAAILSDQMTQASTSMVANLFAGTTYAHKSESGQQGFDATQINLDIAANFKGIVLETGLRYSETSSNPLALADTRLTYDLVQRMVRLEAGDLTVPTSGLQGNPSIAGLASYRNFNLRPDEDFRTNPSQQFELQRPARISVYINGQFIRELRLPSGRYNLTDLPLRASAGNDVTLEILYDTGEIERVVFSAFYDFNLLRKSVSQIKLNDRPR